LADTRLGTLREGDAAEFGQHDRLPAMRIAVEREDAAAGPAPIEELLGFDLRTVALADVLDVGVAVVDADDVGGAAFPAVVADDRTGRVQRLGEVVESLHRMPVLADAGSIAARCGSRRCQGRTAR
jgi:hypothetical protein